MAGTPIEQLHFSVRASNVLHRMGIHTFEELIDTPIESIAQQRNIGVKTLDEIKSVLQNTGLIIEQVIDGNSAESTEPMGFSNEQLAEMSRHSIDELGLSVRPYNALHRAGCLTIDKVALLAEPDFAQMKGLGKKSVEEIRDSISLWIRENIVFENGTQQEPTNADLKNLLQWVSSSLEPIMHLYWKQLYDFIVRTGGSEKIPASDRDAALRTVLLLPEIRSEVKSFWESISIRGMITPNAVSDHIASLNLPFDPEILVDTALEGNIIVKLRDVFLVSRDSFLEAYDKICDPEDRAAQILKFRTEGENLQDIGDLFDLTRERVRQITVKMIRKFPMLFEDYFSEPYKHFHLLKTQFIRAFPEISEEGYEFLSIRYSRGKVALTRKSLEEYTGLWKDQLSLFLDDEEVQDDKKTVSKTEMVMRVLIGNSDNPLSIEEFETEYYRYIERKGYPADRLKINIRTVGNHLRNATGVVFNRDNKVRYCSADPRVVWKTIDFGQYKNMVISSDLIFRDYQDVMEELDIRDGYELFYVIKSSISLWNEKSFSIHCRRVPVIVLGDASEEMQAIKLLKEISPVAYLDYYEAYEERYGLRKESAQGNPTISNTVGAYYIDGQYVIDAPSISDCDIPPFLSALGEKPLWFIEDIELLFDKICIHSTHDAINAAAFRRIGYILHTAYAYKASYGTAMNFFDDVIFCQDIVDLSTLDRRISNLSMFGSALDKKKKSLDYIETAPKVLMSRSKVEEVYGLTTADIRELQSTLSVYYEIPFFNGRSIWHKIQDLPIVKKLQGNDWMLTCIMRQQDSVASISVAGGIILSLESTSLSLSRICEWISSEYGTMSINALEKRFNELFGTRIPASKLAEKLKTSGSWRNVVTDSMDDYIDSLVDADIIDMDANDLLHEEFF